MKQKDYMLLGIIVVISAIVSFIISGKLFATPADRQQQVEQVQTLSAAFPTPNPTYFNTQSIDPTQLIQIANNNNANPFSGN